jgi:hypothetical protein
MSGKFDEDLIYSLVINSSKHKNKNYNNDNCNKEFTITNN